jgi:hypothetical protein
MNFDFAAKPTGADSAASKWANRVEIGVESLLKSRPDARRKFEQGLLHMPPRP